MATPPLGDSIFWFRRLRAADFVPPSNAIRCFLGSVDRTCSMSSTPSIRVLTWYTPIRTNLPLYQYVLTKHARLVRVFKHTERLSLPRPHPVVAQAVIVLALDSAIVAYAQTHVNLMSIQPVSRSCLGFITSSRHELSGLMWTYVLLKATSYPLPLCFRCNYAWVLCICTFTFANPNSFIPRLDISQVGFTLEAVRSIICNALVLSVCSQLHSDLLLRVDMEKPCSTDLLDTLHATTPNSNK